MKNIVAILFVFTSLFASSQTQFIGAPNTTVVARGNMKVDSILYLPKREKTPTDTGALRYQISDSSLYVWTGNAWRKAKNDGTITSVSAGTGMSFTTITSSGSVSADTNVLATKSYRQKGDDSLGAIIATKGTGTVTSVGTGYGIDGGTITTTGTLTADTLNLATRLRLQKVGDSLGVLISNAGGGTVTGVSAGTGMSFTTITSSGAVNADTLVLSTRSWRQKGVDSVSSLVAAKVNISDTATMLSPYAKTSALGLYLPLSGGTLTGGLTGTTGAFTSSGSSNTFDITHSSGSGIGLNITKGGNGEGLYINKTSGTGNAATIVGTLNATTLVKSGGTSTQYLMADGTTSTLTNPVTGTGTTNYVPKFTGTSTLANSSIFDNGNVGIGTETLDSYKFRVQHNSFFVASFTSTGSESIMQFRNTSGRGRNYYLITGGTGGTFANGAFGIYDATGLAARMLIDSLGKVGFGTTTPLSPLHVQSTLNSNVATFTGGQSLRGLRITTFAAPSDDDGVALNAQSSAGVLTLQTNTTERMRITAAGDVGIGNTSPSYKLDITGTLRNTTGAAFATSSGNVLIGTTTDAGYKTDIAGNLRNTTSADFATSSGSVSVGGAITYSHKFAVNGASTQRASMITRGTQGADANLPTTYGTPYLSIGGQENKVGALQTIGFGFQNGTFIQPAEIGYVTTSVSGNTGGDIVMAVRNGTSNVAPTERMRITGAGNVGIGNTAPSEALHVTGRIRATTIDSTATAMNILYADATGVIKKAAVPSGGSGTVTSVATGFGLSGGTITTTGTLIVDSASVATRARVQKGVDSVASIAVKGTGISGYFPKWTGTGTQDTSQLFQLGANIGIGTATPTFRLHLPDAGSTANQAMIAGTIFGSDGNGITISPNSSNITIKGGQGNGLIYSGTISSVARWGINTTSISDAVLSIDGDVKIVTVDSTSTARNMLYQDANGVIKKSAVPSGLTMADDVITASGSWVATKDAGSGTTINNVAYTTNGTTKMVTADANFYIAETGWTDNTWITIGTIPTDYRPKKTINWNATFIVSGAEYERSDNTDFTGACSITGQMRVRDDGTVEINATMGSNSIAAGGTDYIIVPFQVSYIIK